jgi:hypothetical protein
MRRRLPFDVANAGDSVLQRRRDDREVLDILSEQSKRLDGRCGHAQTSFVDGGVLPGDAAALRRRRLIRSASARLASRAALRGAGGALLGRDVGKVLSSIRPRLVASRAASS